MQQGILLTGSATEYKERVATGDLTRSKKRDIGIEAPLQPSFCQHGFTQVPKEHRGRADVSDSQRAQIYSSLSPLSSLSLTDLVGLFFVSFKLIDSLEKRNGVVTTVVHSHRLLFDFFFDSFKFEKENHASHNSC